MTKLIKVGVITQEDETFSVEWEKEDNEDAVVAALPTGTRLYILQED